MDLFAFWLGGDDLAQESNKLGASMARGRFAQHLTVLSIESGIKGEGSVTEVFKAVALRSARARASARLALALQRMPESI